MKREKSSSFIHNSIFVIQFFCMFPKLLSFLAILFILAAPFMVAADNLPGSAGWKIVPDCEDVVPGTTTKECGFKTLVHLIKHLIDFAFFLAMPVATALFTYAGFLYLFEAAKAGSRGKANAIFTSVLIGFFWMLAAWFVVKLITDALLKPEYGTFLGT